MGQEPSSASSATSQGIGSLNATPKQPPNKDKGSRGRQIAAVENSSTKNGQISQDTLNY
jgi:hypothetical protein